MDLKGVRDCARKYHILSTKYVDSTTHKMVIEMDSGFFDNHGAQMDVFVPMIVH
jgi:hypothetical protein